MPNTAVIHTTEIDPALVDYNGHLTEWAYYRIFSDALTKLFGDIGVGKEHRSRTGGTMYSLESHGIFIKEVRPPATLEVSCRVLDFDPKRTHLVLDLHHGENHLASYENVSLYVRQSPVGVPRASSMPDETIAWLNAQREISDNSKWPPFAGRGLSLRRKAK
ncbi:thioesterase family protein [Mesorhizobium retamae]|uniref:Thioesterase family protein n=1 Tax=Mesorhizobium retamae TaxID=2912854 RepID=A0ABS9QFG7_9HYPH|nr:thioesterase family protein [Mesorhizobium sp. IRAMC:0171]MCG7505379.1 thioesterase family protein [Mesorhizobium sp. IRAMC:0171]